MTRRLRLTELSRQGSKRDDTAMDVVQVPEVRDNSTRKQRFRSVSIKAIRAEATDEGPCKGELSRHLTGVEATRTRTGESKGRSRGVRGM